MAPTNTNPASQLFISYLDKRDFHVKKLVSASWSKFRQSRCRKWKRQWKRGKSCQITAVANNKAHWKTMCLALISLSHIWLRKAENILPVHSKVRNIEKSVRRSPCRNWTMYWVQLSLMALSCVVMYDARFIPVHRHVSTDPDVTRNVVRQDS